MENCEVCEIEPLKECLLLTYMSTIVIKKYAADEMPLFITYSVYTS